MSVMHYYCICGTEKYIYAHHTYNLYTQYAHIVDDWIMCAHHECFCQGCF